MPSAQSLGDDEANELTPQAQERLDTVVSRLKLCRWTSGVSLGIGVGAWAFANTGTTGAGYGSLTLFGVSMLVSVVATGAGALLEAERDRLRDVCQQ